MMSFNKNRQFNRGRKPRKRVLIRETREEEAARLENRDGCPSGDRGASQANISLYRDRVGVANRSSRFQSV